MEHKEELGTPQLRAVLKITKETGERLDQDTIVQLLADSRNWIPAFFKEVQPFHGSTELGYKIFKAGIDLTDYYPLYEAWEESQNTMQAAVNRLLEEPEPVPAPAEHSTRAGSEEKYVFDNGRRRPLRKRKELHYKKARELLESDSPPIEYIVDIIIAKGLIILSAKSKIGKSWFALQLAVAVASGFKFLGFETKKGGVLYIDLENTEALSKARLVTVLNGREPPEDLVIINDYSTMNDTFIADLSEYLEENQNTSLVIVDVFQKIKRQKKANQSDYEDIYQHFTELKELTKKYNIGLLLVMHDRKMNDPTDPFNNTHGSMAIMGASDQIMTIQKKERQDIEATLYITGRTVQSGQYVVKFDSSCIWQMVGDAEEIAEKRHREEYEKDPIVKTIQKLVDNNKGHYVGTVTEIIKASEMMQGCRIYQKPQQCGKKLAKLIPLLRKYDAIEHFTAPNGNASSAHEFKKIFV